MWVYMLNSKHVIVWAISSAPGGLFMKQRQCCDFFSFLLGVFFIYISSAIPKVFIPFPPISYPPTPSFWNCPVLRHIKFARPMGLCFHWWPTRPSSDSYSARDTSWGGGGYWLVHIVVPPIGLQIPLAPWVLSLAPPLGALWFLFYFRLSQSLSESCCSECPGHCTFGGKSRNLMPTKDSGRCRTKAA